MSGGRGDRMDRGDRNDRGGGDRGFSSGGDRGFGGGGGGDDDWKSRRPPLRDEGRGGGGSFGGGGFGGGSNGGGGEDAESDWRRDPPSGGSRGNSGFGGSGGFSGASGGFAGPGLRREMPAVSERPRLKLDARSSPNTEAVVPAADTPVSNETSQSSESAPPSTEDKWNNVMGKFNKSSASRSTMPPRAADGGGDFGRFASSRPGGDSFSGGGSRFGDRKPSDFSGGGSSFGNRDSGSRFGGGDSNRYGDRGGSSYGDRGGGGGYRGNDISDPRFNFSSSSSGHHDPAPLPLPSFAPTAEEIKAAEDLKKAKAAKQAERAESERKLNEAKAAAKEAANIALEVEKAAAEVAAGAAAEAFSTGLKGEELVQHINKMEVKPTGAALTAVVLSNLQDPVSMKWCRIAEYGAAMKNLIGGSSTLQLATLKAIQLHLFALKFPKVMDKQKMSSVMAMLFMSLYSNEIIDPAGFSLWAEDDDDSNGKIDAIVQTTNFFQFLTEEEDGDEEEEDDDNEIDAPRPTVK